MGKIFLNLISLLLLLNFIQSSPQFISNIVQKDDLKLVEPKEKDVLQYVDVDLCEQDFFDMNGDMMMHQDQAIAYILTTATCQKNITFYYLQALFGHQIDAYKGDFEKGQWINITGDLPVQKFTFPAGVISVKITRLSAASGSYHQLVSSRDDYLVMTDRDTRKNYGVYHPFPPGDQRKYIVFQPSTTNDGFNGMSLRFQGDCEKLAIWKGLSQRESAKLFGDTTKSCTNAMNRDTLPSFVFGRYLTVETRKPDNCTISWFYNNYDQSTLTYVWPGTSTLLTSPPYSGSTATAGIYLTTFSLQKQTTVRTMTLNLLSPLSGASNLTVVERDGSTTVSSKLYTSAESLCGFTTNYSLDLYYSWACAEFPCEDGLILRYSTTGNPTQIDLCNNDFADLHADMLTSAGQTVEYRVSTTGCNKNFSVYYMEKPSDYMVEAWSGELDNGLPLNIIGSTIPSKLSFPPGVISVRLTRINQNATSYHQLFTTKDDFVLLSDVSTIENSGAHHPFPKGDQQKYILYQAAPTNEGYNGMDLQYSGDCQSLSIWKGLSQSDTTALYGGSSSMCGRSVSRDAFPSFVFSRYLTVETRQPDNCTISWLPHKYDATLDQINVYPSTTGVFTSPQYSGLAAIPGVHFTSYKLYRTDKVERMYFSLLTPLVGDSQLIVTEMQSNKTTTFGSKDSLCNFSSSDTNIVLYYTWSCSTIPCEDGLVVKYSATPPPADNGAGKSMFFIFNTLFIIFAGKLFI